MQFVVLSSSRGTTFQAILDRLADGSLTAECKGLISDRADRGCIEKAKAAGLPTRIVERQEGESREDFDRRLDATILELMGNQETEVRSQKSTTHYSLLTTHSPKTEQQKSKSPEYLSLIACIGWMFILTPSFIHKWKNRVLNVHPALLPKYGGTGMYGSRVHEAVLASGDTESGMTIHLMDEGIDTGAILVQKKCSVLPSDTSKILRTRVQELEKEWYPRTLQMIEEGELKLPS